MRIRETCNEQFLVVMDHIPQKKGLIYIPNAENRKLPCGVVEKVPVGYAGEVEVGKRYLFDNQKTFRVDEDRVLTTEDNLLMIIEKEEEDVVEVGARGE